MDIFVNEPDLPETDPAAAVQYSYFLWTAGP